MGGDDSQKLRPWRGTYSSPGHTSTPAHGNVIPLAQTPPHRTPLPRFGSKAERSILRGDSLGLVDHEQFHRALSCFESESELFLESSDNAGLRIIARVYTFWREV